MTRNEGLLSEALLIIALGVMAALVANFISPRGLSLTRDYFPTKSNDEPSAPVASLGAGVSRNGKEPSAAVAPAPVAVRPQPEIATITTAQAREFYRAPEYEQELIVFVDARDDRHYEAGHIPGAYQLDRYYPEKHLPTVLPVCLNATRVVVYCAGGECEDSHFAAQLLREAGIPAEQLFVYAGGITEWDGGRLPIETGARKSGNLRERPQ